MAGRKPMGKSGPEEPGNGERRATIREVAAAANVSIGTVSRVVLGNVPVSSELSERVLAAAQSLGYRPKGKGIVAAKSPAVRLVGLFVTDLSNLLYGQVVSAVEERLAQLGYTLVVANTQNDERREQELLTLLSEGVLTGAIMSIGTERQPRLKQALRKAKVPSVILDREPPEGVDSVLVDHREGALGACRYLISLGHKRIAMITADRIVRPGVERIAGFAQAHREAGLPFDEELIRAGCITADAACAETRQLLQSATRPTAIMTLGSQALTGTLRGIDILGLSIPKDVSVFCFGDTDTARIVRPPMTCVQWDRRELGRQAVDMLIGRMEGKTDSPPRSIVLPTEIILRQSCAPPFQP